MSANYRVFDLQKNDSQQHFSYSLKNQIYTTMSSVYECFRILASPNRDWGVDLSRSFPFYRWIYKQSHFPTSFISYRCPHTARRLNSSNICGAARRATKLEAMFRLFNCTKVHVIMPLAINEMCWVIFAFLFFKNSPIRTAIVPLICVISFCVDLRYCELRTIRCYSSVDFNKM